MSGFNAAWLALRESADAAARDGSLLARLPVGTGKPFCVIDLGAGTGSNLRYLASRLKVPQDWTLVDDDDALLEVLESPAQHAALETQTLHLDLSHELPSFQSYDLVTASAFFDLVSEAWLTRFAVACAEARVPAGLFALNVDGRIHWQPGDDLDDEIADLFHHHMQRDKGFGVGLGPESPNALTRVFRAIGYDTHMADSAWHISPAQTDMQHALLKFYRMASTEMAPDRAAAIADWSARRAQHIDQGLSHLMVGHRDVLVLRNEML